MNLDRYEVVVVGAGSIGIAVAYYLMKNYSVTRVAIIDPRDPMSLTSAQSGENYRNWWPHPVMTEYTNHSISLMEDIARESDNRINMTRRGYALVTRRKEPEDLIADLYRGYGADAERLVRIHKPGTDLSYQPPTSSDWQSAPDGVDVLCDQELIRKTFPTYEPDIETVIHIRRAGSISGQQLGQFMIEKIKESGGQVIRGQVVGVEASQPFAVRIKMSDGERTIYTDKFVNAAGPFLRDVGNMLGEDLPVTCVYQQKIAFEDREGALPRNLPFTIDLDGQRLDWTDEEREILVEDAVTKKLTEFMAGSIHCRPDGAEDGKWVKLGWAYNDRASDPLEADPIDEQFPDIVLRGASRLQPRLKTYIGRLPRNAHHYGGYYTMTEENLPLIGPMRTPGAYVVGALSGFGTMAACASGYLAAAWITGGELPAYAKDLSFERYENAELMAELAELSRGVL
ncbi:FAD-binding oxidoreductase [Agrobacterium vitis]|uniref:NAD(P)/FAD-dependent oxidoreductase n=1 Tax=Rhizobium/Agrobacterium group TaxID=227290 RepID=UPI001F36FA3D|nr:FAD-binding oxidoreductase [Allorhizobium ampelinum]